MKQGCFGPSVWGLRPDAMTAQVLGDTVPVCSREPSSELGATLRSYLRPRCGLSPLAMLNATEVSEQRSQTQASPGAGRVGCSLKAGPVE